MGSDEWMVDTEMIAAGTRKMGAWEIGAWEDSIDGAWEVPGSNRSPAISIGVSTMHMQSRRCTSGNQWHVTRLLFHVVRLCLSVCVPVCA